MRSLPRSPEHRSHGRFVVDERGVSLVIVVLILPVLILFATLAVDVANWFTHHNHLQVEADAAALAAAQDFQFPCTPGGAMDQQVAVTAHQYDGTGTGTPFNPPFGGATASTTDPTNSDKVVSLINAHNFLNQGSPNDSDLSGSPCTDEAVDVKVTESNSPLFFPIVNVCAVANVICYINAQARVGIQNEASSSITRPFAIQNPTPKTVHVDLIDENTKQDLGCPDAANPCGATLQTSDQQTWSNIAAPLAVTFNDATAAGQDIPVGLRVELSGSTDTTCGDPAVLCYDSGSSNGVAFIRNWSGDGTPGQPANNPAPPQAQDSSLVPITCPDGYFISSATDCSVQVSTNVQFAAGVTCADASVTLTAGSTGNLAMSCPTTSAPSASGTWTSVLPNTITSNSGPESFSLNWKLTKGKVPVGSDSGSGDHAGNCTTNKPCTGSFGLVERTFAGAYDIPSASASRSGPIVQATLTDANSPGTEISSVRRCSTTTGSVYTACTRSVVATVGIIGLQNSETIGSPPIPLRLGSNQGNGTISCVGNNGNPGLQNSIVSGCAPPGFVTTTQPNPPVCTSQNLPPASQPQPCASANPGGGKVNGLEPGMNQLVNGDANAKTCLNPNRWVTPNSVSQILSQNPKDARIIQMIITDAGALNNLSGTTPVPVRAFATFYVTGWDSSQDPCQAGPGISNGYAYTKDDPAATGELVGHFVKFNNPTSTGTGSGTPCSSINTPGDCVAVLTK